MNNLVNAILVYVILVNVNFTGLKKMTVEEYHNSIPSVRIQTKKLSNSLILLLKKIEY